MMASRPQPSSRRPGFTLIEVLLVLGIIAIIGTLGVVGLSALTGQNSREAGQNLVSAALGQARTIALNEGKTAGILFSMDPATGRVAMTIVIVGDPGSGLEDPDPYDKYKAWSANPIKTPTSPVDTYSEYKAAGYDANNNPIAADRVIGLSSDATAVFKPASYGGLTYSRLTDWVGNFRPVVKTYRAVIDNSASATTLPPTNGPYPFNTTPNAFYQRYFGTATAGSGQAAKSTTDAFSNTYWAAANLAPVITTYSGSAERQLLPAGVGCQVIIPPTLRTDQNLTTPPNVTETSLTSNRERYLQLGTILFDSQGKLLMQAVAIAPNSTLGKQLNLDPTFGNFRFLTAGLGVAIFDINKFLSGADPTLKLPTGVVAQQTFADFLSQNVVANNTGRPLHLVPPTSGTTTNDWLGVPYTRYYADNVYSELYPAAGTFDYERREEAWLDLYANRLLVNAYSGSLTPVQQ